MIYDTSRSDIILVSYPSGGFGNFIHRILSMHASATTKISNNFSFSEVGDSHNTEHYCSIYQHDPDVYYPEITTHSSNTLVVLCDNGINNDTYEKINKVFPNAVIVRACIDDEIKPIIYKTSAIKAQQLAVLSLSRDHVKANWVDCAEDYAIRENFTLMYHNWPFKWKAVTAHNVINVSLKNLIDSPAQCFYSLIQKLGMEVINPEELVSTCNKWQDANDNYFTVYKLWQQLETALDTNIEFPIAQCTDLHDQGYLNYCIEKKYNVTIPVYDYRNWFTSSTDILEMIKCLTSKT